MRRVVVAARYLSCLRQSADAKTSVAHCRKMSERPLPRNTTRAKIRQHSKTSRLLLLCCTIRNLDIYTPTMSESQVTLRTRKFIRNPLLGRKQMVVCVPTHPRSLCRHDA